LLTGAAGEWRIPQRRGAARVAMIGAGQLARMTQQAAVDLDIDLIVLAASVEDPAVLAGAAYLLGDHTDLAALVAAAQAAELVTFDHELVPPALLAELEQRGYVLRPGRRALAAAQDKLAARRLLAATGYPVPAFEEVAGAAAVGAFAQAHGWPVVLKARSGGYDGRGVLVLDSPAAIPSDIHWGTPDDPAWLVEEYVELVAELAVLVARRPSGASVTYPVVATTQVDGICRYLVAPAGVAPAVAAEAQRLARSLADDLDATGICAVELFVGPGDRLLVNELALRPHNSGHATIEANLTSQFHQHLRAVLDWPLGPTDLVAPAAAMVNLIAPSAALDVAASLPAALAVPGAQVHLYAKGPRAGRKIGHVTALGSTTADALATAAAGADALLGEPPGASLGTR
jgi:5-(carboxyamino)imidazole ribonucleotide synthase